jgi:CBS domain-containing protein
MGEREITDHVDTDALRAFAKGLLEDVRALERMIANGAFEVGVRRIGAEQEMFLVDSALRPARCALAILGRLPREFFTPELGLFNLEANLSPRELRGDCLAAMERELAGLVGQADEVARSEGARVVLCGILPTLAKSDLGLDSMTPIPRFYQLNRVMSELRGGEFRTYIKGLDELQTTHDNVMLEACNTSFQVHFQVAPAEFAPLYNVAQVVTAPVLAAAVNSPVLLRHRLWHETRVALFQQSLDTRSEAHAQRGGRTRVSFGDDWIDDSVLDIFREDIARYRILIAAELDESPLVQLEEGKIPMLKALRLHNGTVYRWNRPCYGVWQGRPHLRIENRVLPAGPSVVDEIANATFFFGLMCALSAAHEDVRRVMAFDDARENFVAAARYGLGARMHWIGSAKPRGAEELILTELLPQARAGLARHGLEAADVDRYLGVLEERVRSGRTGAQWALDSLEAMPEEVMADERYRALTAAMLERQASGRPVHEWELAPVVGGSARDSFRTIGQVMETDLFTVHPEDLVDIAASVMDWEHLRHVPVEDDKGRLVGLITHRQLLRMVGRGDRGARPVAVREIMRPNPVTVTPETSTLEAIERMRAHKVGCLPVVRDDGILVGIVTESDFIGMAAKLLDRWLRDE